MNISSMTGFSRVGGDWNAEKTSFCWFFELKSVNGKSLDIKTKLPSWQESLALPMKNEVAQHFLRGNISIYLDISSSNSGQELKINEDLLNVLAVKAIELSESFGDKLQKPSASDLLGLKGVVELQDARLNDEELETLQKEIMKSFQKACQDLKKDREKEGEKIRSALLVIVEKISEDIERIENIAGNLSLKIKEKLLQQVADLYDGANQISEERIAQEMVFYVARADIREEIDRLRVHIKTAKELFNSDEAVGRRLDFLCQELNREANTTCSKSCDIELTNIGMNLKILIEQLREQVQNIE